MVNTARHHIARGQVAPLRVVVLHERRAVGMHQAPAFAAYSFRDEEMGRVWMEKRRWVELHELHVDDARPRPIGNGHPITARPSRIGRTQENLPESSSRQHGMP